MLVLMFVSEMPFHVFLHLLTRSSRRSLGKCQGMLTHRLTKRMMRTAGVVDRVPRRRGGDWFGPNKRPLMEVLVSSQGVYANYSANRLSVMLLLPRVPELLSGPRSGHPVTPTPPPSQCS